MVVGGESVYEMGDCELLLWGVGDSGIFYPFPDCRLLKRLSDGVLVEGGW